MTQLQSIAHAWWNWMLPSSMQLVLLTAIVALLAWLARKSSARLRHGLWLLVLLKVFLPPTLAAPWSLGTVCLGTVSMGMPSASTWGLDRLFGPSIAASLFPSPGDSTTNDPITPADDGVDFAESGAVSIAAAEPDHLTAGNFNRTGIAVLLLFVWGAGVLAFWGLVIARLVRLRTLLDRATELDEGPARVRLEVIAMQLGVRRIPDLLAIDETTSPFLVGVIQPRIVVPSGLLAQFNSDQFSSDQLDSELSSDLSSELDGVLTHELVHCRRHDTAIGWLQVAAQSLFWFHPLVWWANAQLRLEREKACDEAVLQSGDIAPQTYLDSIVRVLTSAAGRSVATGQMVGIFERGSQLQSRWEDIMSFQRGKRRFGRASQLMLALVALLLLPMGAWTTQELGAQQLSGAEKEPVTKQTEESAPPKIVKTSPAIGATDVDPDLNEISVTFDQPMQKGMSWTGGPPLLPEIDESRKPRWIDAQTCVVSVKLRKGTFYRLGINSTSHQNFRSQKQVAADPSAIYFVTAGANEETMSRVRAPKIVSLTPSKNAEDVDPKLTQLQVTFDMPMGDGMSWTGSGPMFPQLPEGQKPSWSADGLTCTLPVRLEPEHDYLLGLNSRSHVNFQSRWGVPLEPVKYSFRTAK